MVAATAPRFRHLTQAPALTFLRIGPDLHLSWRAPEPEAPHWVVPCADLVLPFAQAHRAVACFCGDFLGAMEERVDAIARDGWLRQDCIVDVPGLVAEQRERATWPAADLSRAVETDWDAVRRAQAELSLG